MKILGLAISRDYEEAKTSRREALENKANVEFLIEHGNMGTLQKKFIWRLDGAHYPLFSWHLTKLLCSAIRILWRRLVSRLSR